MSNSDYQRHSLQKKKSRFFFEREEGLAVFPTSDNQPPSSQRGLLSQEQPIEDSDPSPPPDWGRKMSLKARPLVFVRRPSSESVSLVGKERRSIRNSVFTDSVPSSARVSPMDERDSMKSVHSIDRNARNSRRSTLENNLGRDFNRKQSKKNTYNGRKKSRIKKEEESWQHNSGSDQNSVILQVQDLFNNKLETGDISSVKNTLTPNTETAIDSQQRKKSINFTSIKAAYYNLLKHKIKRRPSHQLIDRDEFLNQIQICKENLYIPNEERLRDLMIVDKTSLEKAEIYTDKFPLLKLRKKIMRNFKLVSVACQKIIENPLFDYFILVIIILNSLSLALDDPTSDESSLFSDIVDDIFLGIYTVEMLLKIFGMGFLFNRNAYLRDAWNILDFIIVVTAYIPFIFSSSSVSLQAFRSLRVLRPLRTISNIEALRVLIGTLIAALPPLLDTLLILLFLFMIFAIGGVQLFSGLMKKRCFSLDEGIPLIDLGESATDFQKYCTNDDDCGTVNGSMYICGKMINNPNDDVTSFDNILSAFLMVFQVVTLEGWNDMMLALQKTFSPLAALYFVFLIFVGSFFLLNLTLAVIKAEFTSNSHKSAREAAKELTYDEKLAEKMEQHKVEIVSLMNKKREGILLYNKFLIKNKNLVALEDRQAKKYMAERFRSKRRMASKLDPGQVQHKDGFLQGLKKSISHRPSIATVVRQILDKTKGRGRATSVSSGKKNTPVPEDSSTPQINIFAAARSSRASPFSSKLDLTTHEKSELMVKDKLDRTSSPPTRKSAFATSSPNHVFNISGSQIDPNETPTERRRLISPQKQNFIRISSSSGTPEPKETGTGGNVPSIQVSLASRTGTPNQLGQSDFSRKKSVFASLSPVKTLEIPCIAEVEESSDFDASSHRKGSEMGNRSISAAPENSFISSTNSPKPALDKKISINAGADSKKGIRIINIAGVIGSLPIETGDAKKLKRVFSREESFVPLRVLKKKDSVEDDRSFFETLDTQTQPETINPKKIAKETMVKQINHIGTLKLSKGYFKRQSIVPSLNMTEDMDALDGEKKPSLNIPSGLLNDSDFIKGEKSSGQKKFRKQLSVKKRTMSKKNTKTNAKRLSLMGENGLMSDAQNPTSLEKLRSRKTLGSNGQIDATDDTEEKFIIDVRYLKLVPKKRQDYETWNLNDVLPSIKEKEKMRIEEQEIRLLKETRLPLEFKITSQDETNHNLIVESKYNVGKYSASFLAVKPSQKALVMRQRQKEEEDFDKDINELMHRNQFDRGMTSSPSRTLRTTTTMRGKQRRKATHFFQTKIEDDDYLPVSKMKDFFEVLNWMSKPFDSEKQAEDPKKHAEVEKEFDLYGSHRGIRRKDIDDEKVQENNWSGDAVLPMAKSNFSFLRIKMALNNQDFDIWRPGLFGLYWEARRKVRQFTESSLFNNFILLSVIMNTIILASDNLVSDDTVNTLFDKLNQTFTIVFVVEMGLKLFGYGVFRYASDKINLFDATIVVLSIVEWVFMSGSGGQGSTLSAFRSIRLFRTFRVLRVTKLLRSLAYMKVIIGVIMRSIKKFIYIAALLLLLIFIYSLLGMQIFGGEFNFPDNTGDPKPRQNFDTFVQAFMTVFQIMTQENWQNILYVAMRSTVSKPITVIYLVSWIFIGNYIFLNLFVAILLDEFTSEEVEGDLEEAEEKEEEDLERTNTSVRETLMLGQRSLTPVKSFSKELKQLKSSVTTNDVESVTNDRLDEEIEHPFIMFDQVRCQKVFYIFSMQNKFRQLCYRIVKHKYFDRAILFMIVFSSIKLALDTYVSSSNVTLTKVSDIVDTVINIIFCFEALFKIMAYGFLFDGNSYLRETWNILDFIIVIASILDMIMEDANLSFIRVLRLLRTLRPLRFISHNQNMRLVVTALLESVGAIVNVVIVVLIIWLMFAILAVNLVGGKMGVCAGLPSDISKYGIGQSKCISMGYSWNVPDINFDNVLRGMLSLFVISTQEGWPDIMYTVVDANDAEEGPLMGGNELFGYVFFVVFLFVGSYFLLNLFVGVIFLKFIQAQRKENKLKNFLDSNQERWVILQRLILLTKPDTSFVEPETAWMKPIFRFTNNNIFDVAILTCIMLNILSMALTFDGASDEYNNMLKVINLVFSSIFLVEMILKHLALGFKRYWRNNWNKFDAFVVFASILDILLDFMQQSFFSFIRAGPQLARVMRVLRVSRLLKLVKKFQGLQQIINTLIFSLSSLLNVGALLLLVYFIYAVLATFIFGTIQGGKVIDDYVNFQNFSNALVTLFRASTGEDWYIIMFDTINPQTCTDGTSSCGSVLGAILFWVSFIVICQFIFLNLFILVILQQFEEYYLNKENPVNKFRDDLEAHFRPTWEKFSAKYRGIEISENQLLTFFRSMPPPLGFKNDRDYPSKNKVAKEITQMNLLLDPDGMLFFNDVLFGTYKRAYGTEEIIANSDYMIKEEMKTRRKLDNIRKKQVTTWRGISNTLMVSMRKNKGAVNPIFKLLFLGMTMRAWMKYAKKTAEKIRAAQAQEYEYISSGSDEEDYTDITSDQSEDEDEEESCISEDGEDPEEDIGQIIKKSIQDIQSRANIKGESGNNYDNGQIDSIRHAKGSRLSISSKKSSLNNEDIEKWTLKDDLIEQLNEFQEGEKPNKQSKHKPVKMLLARQLTEEIYDLEGNEEDQRLKASLRDNEDMNRIDLSNSMSPPSSQRRIIGIDTEKVYVNQHKD